MRWGTSRCYSRTSIFLCLCVLVLLGFVQTIPRNLRERVKAHFGASSASAARPQVRIGVGAAFQCRTLLAFVFQRKLTVFTDFCRNVMLVCLSFLKICSQDILFCSISGSLDQSDVFHVSGLSLPQVFPPMWLASDAGFSFTLSGKTHLYVLNSRRSKQSDICRQVLEFSVRVADQLPHQVAPLAAVWVGVASHPRRTHRRLCQAVHARQAPAHAYRVEWAS